MLESQTSFGKLSTQGGDSCKRERTKFASFFNQTIGEEIHVLKLIILQQIDTEKQLNNSIF